MSVTAGRSGRFAFRIVLFATALVIGAAARAVAQPPVPGELRWGGDPEGGAPYVEADPSDPDAVVGLRRRGGRVIARGLGLRPRFVSVQFTSIDASVKRGDFRHRPERHRRHAGPPRDAGRHGAVLRVPRGAHRPRAPTARGYRTLADFRGKRVGTLGGTIAYEILLKAQAELGVVAVSYDDDVHPYSDLVLGRLDAVLLDNVLADKAMRREHGLVTLPGTVAVGHYVGVLDRSNAALRDRIDAILRAAMRDGTLEAIFRRWGVWNDDQPALYARVLGERARQRRRGCRAGARSAGSRPRRAVPTACRGGAALPAGAPPRGAHHHRPVVPVDGARRRGRRRSWRAAACMAGRCCAALLTAYVELTRGTPVLLQLFVLYYGLAEFVPPAGVPGGASSASA